MLSADSRWFIAAQKSNSNRWLALSFLLVHLSKDHNVDYIRWSFWAVWE